MPSLWGTGGSEVGWGDHLIDPKVLGWHTNGSCTNPTLKGLSTALAGKTKAVRADQDELFFE